MSSTRADGPHGTWVIVLSLILSLMLGIAPLPAPAELLRPDFALLGLLYWCLALPERVGVNVAWVLGLFQDVLDTAILGQHALVYALLALIAVRLHQRVRLFPLWQQAIGIALLLTLGSILHLWVYRATGHPQMPLVYWLPVLAGALLWPPWFLTLRWLRRHFQVR